MSKFRGSITLSIFSLSTLSNYHYWQSPKTRYWRLVRPYQTGIPPARLLALVWAHNPDLPNFSLPSNPPPTTTQNGRVAGLVVNPFRFSKISPKSLTSNPRLQPDTHFAVDMFPYKKTELFRRLGFTSQLPKKPGNTPLSGTWFYFLDINTTVSTCVDRVIEMHFPEFSLYSGSEKCCTPLWWGCKKLTWCTLSCPRIEKDCIVF